MGADVKPSQTMRAGIYTRDFGRCVRCGKETPLTIQHRKATGMGGSKEPLSPSMLVTACADCNDRFERDLQTEALRCGWKVKYHGAEGAVPVFYAWRGAWAVLDEEFNALTILPISAVAHMQRVYGEELWEQWQS